jgi:hypothetical protein
MKYGGFLENFQKNNPMNINSAVEWYQRHQTWGNARAPLWKIVWKVGASYVAAMRWREERS